MPALPALRPQGDSAAPPRLYFKNTSTTLSTCGGWSKEAKTLTLNLGLVAAYTTYGALRWDWFTTSQIGDIARRCAAG